MYEPGFLQPFGVYSTVCQRQLGRVAGRRRDNNFSPFKLAMVSFRTIWRTLRIYISDARRPCWVAEKAKRVRHQRDEATKLPSWREISVDLWIHPTVGFVIVERR